MEDSPPEHPCGVRVLWARTIKEAAAYLNSVGNRTVVLTELAVQDGNWSDMLQTVRYASIPVLLTTSKSTPELWWDALDCGVEDILPAPLSTTQLCEYIEKQFTTEKK